MVWSLEFLKLTKNKTNIPISEAGNILRPTTFGPVFAWISAARLIRAHQLPVCERVCDFIIMLCVLFNHPVDASGHDCPDLRDMIGKVVSTALSAAPTVEHESSVVTQRKRMLA